MTPKKNNSESAVKQWQVDVLEKRLEAYEESNKQINNKLDVILQNQVTNVQLEQQLRSMLNSIEAQKSYIDSEIEKVHLTYGPFLKTSKYIASGISLLLAAQVISAYFNFIAGK